MKENVKRVFYVRQVAHPCYVDIIAQRPEIRLDRLENDARDELPLRFHVTGDSLARMRNLLIVSSSGAGFDTISVEECTKSGVLVVNQSGGNAEAVAAHVLAM